MATKKALQTTTEKKAKKERVVISRRTSYYKLCDLDERGISLSESLSQAFFKLKVGQRFQNNDTTGSRRFLNNLFDLGDGRWCGSLYQFTPGIRPPTVKIDMTAQSLELVAIRQLADDEEIVESVLYFTVSQNHVIVTSAGGLRALQLEEYLNWLIREASEVLKDQVPFRLHDEPSKKLRQDGGLTDIKSLSFSAPLTGAVLMSTAAEESSTPFRVARVLGDFLRRSAEELLPQVELTKPEELDRLSVNLEISYVGRARKGDGTGLLDWLARTMDDDLGDRASFVARGLTLSGNDLKLKEVLSIAIDADGRLDLKSSGNASVLWLLSLLSSERVRPCKVT